VLIGDRTQLVESTTKFLERISFKPVLLKPVGHGPLVGHSGVFEWATELGLNHFRIQLSRHQITTARGDTLCQVARLSLNCTQE